MPRWKTRRRGRDREALGNEQLGLHASVPHRDLGVTDLMVQLRHMQRVTCRKSNDFDPGGGEGTYLEVFTSQTG